jgi:hypothetical protein
MRLRSTSTIGGSSGPTSATTDVTAVVKAAFDKEIVDKKAVEEATTKEAADKRDVEEATVMEAANKEAADKRATEEAVTKEAVDKEVIDKRAVEEAAMKEAVVVAVGCSSAFGQVPSSVVGAKMVATPSGSTPPAKRPYRGIWKPRFVQFSCTPLYSPRSKVQF